MKRRHSPFYTWFAATMRWLHIYVSLVGFTALLFFAVTGITLNHPTWLGGDAQHVTDFDGTIPEAVLPRKPLEAATESESTSDAEEGGDDGVDRLAVAEHLRATHSLRGKVSEFRVDDTECMVLFRGPAYAADAYLDRATGKYTVTQTAMGLVALMNDLHKGRDSGQTWSLVIDISGVLMIVVSITGLVLVFYLRRRKRSGLISVVVGTFILIGAYYFGV
ncbi:hypothetical protein Pan44_17460 [Caulifigura coniformis]|uniref:PepSY-associated TM helix n=1 Tax=Caulifigura coniformis TaxID=2527983 RepID=A0A517SC78_9PLAN|nr:PepSY-associated TM helix domain-containing protein [Caulifigura coniformis]QDT53723.1 hypothetical protein Pan44_17460 [Caulifigura coniformis]